MEFLLDAHPLIFIAFAVVATMMFLPGSVTMTLSGFLYGLAPGLLYAAVAIPVGAQCAFAVGRWLARSWVRRRTAASPRLRALEVGLGKEAFWIIALSRLSLVVPFNVFNYVCGASPARARTYFVATTLGMLPAIGLYVYLGTLAHDISQVMSGESTPTTLSWWLLGVGAVLLLVLVAFVKRTAARALQGHLPPEEQKPSAV